MSNNLTYTTKEEDGIEFYVSDDGDLTGMSISGLARCCGVHRKTVQNLLQNIDAASSTILKPELFTGKVYIDLMGAASENNAKIINSKVCAELITYYAFKSKNASNDVAKETLGKFAMIGIDTWIKNVTGYSSENHYQKIESKIDKLLEMFVHQQEEYSKVKTVLDELQPVVEEYTNVKDGIRTSFRGLETVMDHVKNEQHVLPTGNAYTLSEWLQTKDITLNHGGLRKLGRTVAETFKTCTVAKPKKKNYLKPNGKWSCNCTAYSEEHFPLLEMALNQFLQN